MPVAKCQSTGAAANGRALPHRRAALHQIRMAADHGLWGFALARQATGADQRGKLRGANAGLVTPPACAEKLIYERLGCKQLEFVRKTLKLEMIESASRSNSVRSIRTTSWSVAAEPSRVKRIRFRATHLPASRETISQSADRVAVPARVMSRALIATVIR